MMLDVKQPEVLNYDDYVAMTTKDLLKALHESFGATVTNLVRLAMIVRALEARGEHVPCLDPSLDRYIRQIAYGNLLPEVVVRYSSVPSLMRLVALLPTPDQQRLAKGEPIKVVEVQNGQTTTRLVDPLKMSREQRDRVFTDGRIRDEAEQANLLARNGREVPKSPPVQRGPITVDRVRKKVRVNGREVELAAIVDAFASLQESSDDSDAKLVKQVTVRLTEAEHQNLAIVAAKRKCTPSQLLRRAGLLYRILTTEDQ